MNGNAAAIDAVCRGRRPPARSSTVASKDCTSPQIIFFLFDGLRSPPEVNIPRTNVAEFADVTKNVQSKTNVIAESIEPSG